MTAEDYVQAIFNTKDTGVDFRQTSDVARPAHLKSLVVAYPLRTDFIVGDVGSGEIGKYQKWVVLDVIVVQISEIG